MPTFYSRPHGTGIADSIRAMLSSSPNLSDSDIVKVGLIHAQTQQHTALAEKARQEIEAERESARMRQDPALANEYASTTSGITVPQGRQLGGFIRGDTIAPITPVDDSGNVNAVAEYARPDVTQEQERGFRSAIGALIANRMATGKTNAEQLTQGGGNLLTQAIRSQISATPDVAEQNQLKAAIAPGYREPYSGGAAGGAIVNQETGKPVALDANQIAALKAGHPTNLQHFTDQMGKVWAFDPRTGTASALKTPQGGAVGELSTSAAGGAQLSGPDFLASLPKPQADQIKALAEGRMQFPAGFALKSPYWQDMISKVSQYDPSFDAVNYNARARTRADATVGTMAKSNNALNTGIGHLMQLSDAVEGLGNVGSMPFARTINLVKNVASKESGGTGVTDFESIVNRVAPEITKIWRGAGGAELDIKRDIDSLSNANTPEQLHSAIRNIAGLMESKLESNANQYKQGMGTAQQNVQFIMPQAQQQLDALRTRSGAKASTATAAPKYSQADLEYTAKKRGMTVEQVKAKLGITD